MSNEKFYQYFRVSGPEVRKLIADYDEIEAKRKQVLQKMLQDSGAIAFTERRGWGENGTLVRSLAFKAGHDFGTPVTIERRDRFDGQDVIIVHGRGRSKEARAFTDKLKSYVKAANDELINLPSFKDYLIRHYGVACTGIGGPSGRGFGSAMLSTNCGVSLNSDVLMFAIPTRSTGCKVPEIPAGFEELTYGQFYDLANPD